MIRSPSSHFLPSSLYIPNLKNLYFMSTRRTFLHTLGVGAGLSALAPTLLSAAPLDISASRPAKKLRVALMGLGSYANRVAEHDADELRQ